MFPYFHLIQFGSMFNGYFHFVGCSWRFVCMRVCMLESKKPTTQILECAILDLVAMGYKVENRISSYWSCRFSTLKRSCICRWTCTTLKYYGKYRKTHIHFRTPGIRTVILYKEKKKTVHIFIIHDSVFSIHIHEHDPLNAAFTLSESNSK